MPPMPEDRDTVKGAWTPEEDETLKQLVHVR